MLLQGNNNLKNNFLQITNFVTQCSYIYPDFVSERQIPRHAKDLATYTNIIKTPLAFIRGRHPQYQNLT
jgi:hypothetical protein